MTLSTTARHVKPGVPKMGGFFTWRDLTWRGVALMLNSVARIHSLMEIDGDAEEESGEEPEK